MREQNQIAPVDGCELLPFVITAIVREREHGELAVWPADGNRIPLVPYAMIDGILHERAGGLARPVETLPVDGVEALITPGDHRIEAEIALLDVAIDPFQVIGSAAILFTIAVDPVIDNVVDPISVAQF